MIKISLQSLRYHLQNKQRIILDKAEALLKVDGPVIIASKFISKTVTEPKLTKYIWY